MRSVGDLGYIQSGYRQSAVDSFVCFFPCAPLEAECIVIFRVALCSADKTPRNCSNVTRQVMLTTVVFVGGQGTSLIIASVVSFPELRVRPGRNITSRTRHTSVLKLRSSTESLVGNSHRWTNQFICNPLRTISLAQV